MADVNYDPGETLNKKIRNAQLSQFNFILGEWKLFCIFQAFDFIFRNCFLSDRSMSSAWTQLRMRGYVLLLVLRRYFSERYLTMLFEQGLSIFVVFWMQARFVATSSSFKLDVSIPSLESPLDFAPP